MSGKIPEYYGIGDIAKMNDAQLGVTLEDMYQKLALAVNSLQPYSISMSITANGYVSFGGLILQWGSVGATPVGVVFTWPIPFPTNVFSVTVAMSAGAAQSSAITALNLNNVTVYSQNGLRTVYIMAIGN